MGRIRTVGVMMLVAVLGHAGTAIAQGGRAWRVRCAGDLDAMAIVGRLDAVLEDAERRHAQAVLLELGGNRWRTDVVWAMARVVQQRRIRVIALLGDDEDGVVGAGQLMLATLCDSSWIDPGTRIESDQSDDLADWAPADTDFERVHRELAGSIWLRLREREGPVMLARALVSREESVWLADADETVTFEEPPPEQATALIEYRDDGFRMRIDAAQSVRLKLVGGIESRPAVVLRAEGVNPVSPRRVELDSGLEQAHRRAWTMLNRVASYVDGLEQKGGSGIRVTGDGRGAERVRSGLNAVRRRLAELDVLLDVYPEIPRLEPRRAGGGDFAGTVKKVRVRIEKLAKRGR